jgi:hypothetical protein
MSFYGDTYVDINLRNPGQSWQERREYYTHVIRNDGFRVEVNPRRFSSEEILPSSVAQSNSYVPPRSIIPE